jgi:flagellar biosynthesis protein FlhB
MAEDKGFDPTPARLARARREGDAPSSSAFGVLAAFGGASLALTAVLGVLAAAVRTAFASATREHGVSPGPYLVVAACALAVPCGGIVGAIAAVYLQAGRIVVRAPSPKVSKLNPFAGLKRMFSRDAALGGARALVVAIVVAGAVVPTLTDGFGAAARSGSAATLAALVVHAAATMTGLSLGVAALFGVADLFLERAKWRRRLRMSFDEIKREYRQHEGDPRLRGQRRRAHRALVRGSIGRLKEAAFVVCNPTHVAVALEYRPPDVVVPRVIVRAIDAGALEVKRQARVLGVPIFEDVALARTLLGTSVDEYIPAATYAAVAAIVSGLLRERGRA